MQARPLHQYSKTLKYTYEARIQWTHIINKLSSLTYNEQLSGNILQAIHIRLHMLVNNLVCFTTNREPSNVSKYLKRCRNRFD